MSKYWSFSGNGSKSTEVLRRSISPLKCIFDYQEEHVFDIPPERNLTPKIKIENFESTSKKSKLRRRPRKLGRKGSAQNKNNKIIKGLSFILSELESQDETKHSDSNGCHGGDYSFSDEFHAKMDQKNNNTTQKKMKSRRRSKASNSSKAISNSNSLLKPASKKPRARKDRHVSVSYAQASLLNIVKSLDEISTEMESSYTNM